MLLEAGQHEQEDGSFFGFNIIQCISRTFQRSLTEEESATLKVVTRETDAYWWLSLFYFLAHQDVGIPTMRSHDCESQTFPTVMETADFVAE